MSICLDYAWALGAWHDKEGVSYWPLGLNPTPETAGDVIPPRCSQCGKPEHGSAGCTPQERERG